MVANEDELELVSCMKNTLKLERGNGWLGEEEADFIYIGNSLVPVGVTNQD
jgi:hypothetical protein